MKVNLSTNVYGSIFENTEWELWIDLIRFDFWCLMPLSAISWRPVLVVEEAGVPGENHRPWARNW
jgi:hypothetical protein